jgi:hypothetical protein
MKSKYIKHIMEAYGLTIDETPAKLKDKEWRLNDGVLNEMDAKEVLKRAKNMGMYRISNMEFRLYFENERNVYTYYLIEPKNSFIDVEYSYNKISKPINGIENAMVWNSRYNKGLARNFIEDYILNKEPRMISDITLSEGGFKFWKNLFDDMVINRNSHKLYVINFESGEIVKDINKEDDMDEFFGDGRAKFRFVLGRK